LAAAGRNRLTAGRRITSIPEVLTGGRRSRALERRFGVGEELIQAFFQPYACPDREPIAGKGLDFAEVERAVAAELARFDGVAAAVPGSALRSGVLPDAAPKPANLRNFRAGRCGDIFVIFEPNVFINDFDGLTVATLHGWPWLCDTHVSVMFAGAGPGPRPVTHCPR